MFFKVTEKDVFKENPELKLIDGFKECKDKELKYVFLCYDYSGPFRKLPKTERQQKAMLAAGYEWETHGKYAGVDFKADGRKIKTGSNDRVEVAKKVFLDLQFDEDRDLLDSYDAQLEEFKEFLRRKDKNDKELDKSLKIMEKYPKLLAQRKEILEVLELRGVASEIDDEQEDSGKPISTLDEFNIEKIKK